MRPMQNISVAPWYVLHLMVTCVIALELAFSAVFYSPTEFLINVISPLLALYSAIHVWSRALSCS